MKWQDGAINTGSNTLTNSGQLAIDPANEVSIAGAIDNYGTVTQSGGLLFIVDGATFTNEAAGVYDIIAGVYPGPGEAISNDNTGRFENYGLLESNAGTGTSILVTTYLDNLGGTLDAETGTLNLQVGLSGGADSLYQDGTYEAASGATLDLTDGTSVLITGTLTGAGAGTVLLEGGSLQAATSAGATLNFDGQFTWSGGTLDGTIGAITIAAGSSVAIGPNEATNTVTVTGAVNNLGSVTQIGNLYIDDGAVFTNEASGSDGYYLESNAESEAIYTNISGEFVNAGRFLRAGSGTDTIESAFSNQNGTVFVNSGALSILDDTDLSSGLLSGGSWVAEGGSLTLNSGDAVTDNSAYVQLYGPGSDFTNLSGLTTNDGSLVLADGAIYSITANLTNNGQIAVGSGQLDVEGDYTQSGGGALEVGYVGRTDSSGPSYGQLSVSGNVSLAGTLSVYLISGNAPSAGDTLQPVALGGSLSGTFDTIGSEITGVSFTPQYNAEQCYTDCRIRIRGYHDRRQRRRLLRQAVLDANSAPGSEIDFDPSVTGTIVLTSGELDITSDVTIVGPGAGVLAISGNNASAIFNIASDVTASISGLSLIDGNGTYGGALFNEGTLTIAQSVFANNAAPAGLGGAIYNRALVGHPIDGLLTLSDDTFSNNSAVDAGAIDNWAGGDVTINNSTFNGNSAQSGGAILNEWGTVEIADSTFTANMASVSGGAIMNESGQAVAAVTVIDSTISGNSAATGGGIENQVNLTLGNSIVSGNTATNAAPDIDGAITTDNGYNLLGTQVSASAGTDVFNDTPLLAPLGNYGGPTETMALLPGSPGPGSRQPRAAQRPPSSDQRGLTRVVNGTVDIGAFENQIVNIGGTPLSATEGQSFSGTLTVFRDFDSPNIAITAVINWGDGNSSTVTTASAGDDQIISFGSGYYGVVASHTYAEAGGYGVTVTITDADGNTATGFPFIQVQDAQLTAGPSDSINATQGEPLTGYDIFDFTDDNASASANDFSAQADLGDGNTVTTDAGNHLQIVSTGGGGFSVLLSYTYTSALNGGTFNVTVNDIGGQSTSGSGSVNVASAANPLVVTTTADDGAGSLRGYSIRRRQRRRHNHV